MFQKMSWQISSFGHTIRSKLYAENVFSTFYRLTAAIVLPALSHDLGTCRAPGRPILAA